MNRHVQAWSAERYYRGHLHPHPEIADRDVVAAATQRLDGLGASAVQLISHDHRGDHRSNAGEAALVADLVQKLLSVGAVSCPQVGVIAPHRMQNGAICRALQERLGCEAASAVRVDTVERFQGQEREVIVLSFGCDFESPAEEGRRAVFLGDPRRINVSVTRARSRFYCLASERLGEISSARRGQAEARELRDFLEWCRAPARGGRGSTAGRAGVAR
jgi:DNA replication ATP-dependent helicase Dna2